METELTVHLNLDRLRRVGCHIADDQTLSACLKSDRYRCICSILLFLEIFAVSTLSKCMLQQDPAILQRLMQAITTSFEQNGTRTLYLENL